MGKYDKDIQESATWTNKAEIDIANELAEQNRLRRLDLELRLMANAHNRLYKRFELPDGKIATVPPDDKAKEEYKKEVEAIKKELKDQA